MKQDNNSKFKNLSIEYKSLISHSTFAWEYFTAKFKSNKKVKTLNTFKSSNIWISNYYNSIILKMMASISQTGQRPKTNVWMSFVWSFQKHTNCIKCHTLIKNKLHQTRIGFNDWPDFGEQMIKCKFKTTRMTIELRKN